jgi:hypothetical protein
MECFTLWTADQWLMRNSFELHGIFSTIKKAVAYAKKEELLDEDNTVLVKKGIIDNYDATDENVFSSVFDNHRAQLLK